MKVKMTRGISDSNIKKATAALENSRKQIDKLLTTCKQVETGTRQLFDDNESRNGLDLKECANTLVKHLSDCRDTLTLATETVYEIPVSNHNYPR